MGKNETSNDIKYIGGTLCNNVPGILVRFCRMSHQAWSRRRLSMEMFVLFLHRGID